MANVVQLTEDEQSIVVTLLEALDAGWVVVDEEEDFDYVLLFNESRTEMEDFKPSKLLIQKTETMGLIVDQEATFGSRLREIGTHYGAYAPDWEVTSVETPLPVVYLYTVTQKGRSFLSDRNGLNG
jgi:hypothetical protein